MTDKELMLDVGQANEIKLAARRAGATNADLKWLSEGDVFAQILPVIRGTAKVVHTINCDADPFTPVGWIVEEHRRSGQQEWDPKKIKLHLDEAQKNGMIKGDELRKHLNGLPILNANVLDYLLTNPHLIPKDWEGKCVAFWGTIYRDSGDGRLHVRYLYWNSRRWSSLSNWLDVDWDYLGPAALLTS